MLKNVSACVLSHSAIIILCIISLTLNVLYSHVRLIHCESKETYIGYMRYFLLVLGLNLKPHTWLIFGRFLPE